MKRRTILGVALCVLLWAVTPAWAQIAFDTANSGTFTADATPSISLTVASGTNRGLYGCLAFRSGTSRTSDGMTYNSVSMTKIAEAETTGGPGDQLLASLWRLENPATGANTLAGEISDTADGVIGAISLTGVDQTDSEEANNTAIGDSTTPSVAVTTITDNAWVVDCMVTFAEEGSIASDQTERWEELAIPGGAQATAGPKTPAGSVTMSYVNGFSTEWVIVAAAIKLPAAAAVSPRRRVVVIQ